MYKLIFIALTFIAAIMASRTKEPDTLLRLVKARLLIDNKIVFEFSKGDDGHADADEVWDYLKSSEFRPAQNFSEISKDLGSVDNNGTIKFNVRVRINVSYGGEIDFPPGLRLTKTKEGGYLMNTEDVDISFVGRMITRESAIYLTRPKASWDERMKLLEK